MPKQVMDYSKCIIYKITCNDESVTECYVGHTTNFVKRKYHHKHRCKTSNIKLYKMIREHGGWENWTIIPICEYPCENLIQVCIKEEEYRLELQASLNMIKAYRSEEYKTQYNQEWVQYHKEEHNEQRRINYEAKKEQINEQRRINYEANKKQLLERNKIWREANKEKVKEKDAKRHKIYYEKNKEEIKEKEKLRYQKKLVQTEK